MSDPWFILVVATWIAAAVLIPHEYAWKGNISRAIRKLPFLRKFRDTMNLWLFLWWGSLGIFVLTDTNIVWLYIGDGIRRLDDLLTHDDDQFRRFFEGVRNKIKWKMDLPPKPAPIPRAK